MKLDVILQYCIFVDYPFFREWLKKYRSKFDKIILYPSRQHGVLDLQSFAEEQIKETWVLNDVIDWTEPGLDWRQREVEPCLELSNSEWILFMEQDFFCDDWDKLWVDVEKAMETADLIGWWNASAFPYIHPCFCLIKRELLDRTNKDFRAHPEVGGSDHYAMITKDAERLGATIVKLQDLGWTDPEHAFHLGGLTYPYQDFKGDDTIIGTKYPEALFVYNSLIRPENFIKRTVPLSEEFSELSSKLEMVLTRKGIEYNPKWEKFFQI